MRNDSDLNVVAVVTMNGGEALVLNRPLKMIYEQAGIDLVGRDGPFIDFLKYELGSGRFVAFAGRELQLQMVDGTTRAIKNHWWHGVPHGTVPVAIGSEEGLSKCYVFSSMSADPEDIKKLRDKYSGDVFPYWDYEKMVRIRPSKKGD
jgi:hypothetical protein